MTERSVSYTFDVRGLRDLIESLRRVNNARSWRTTGRLETILQQAFAMSQTNVHVITGRLKATARTRTDFDGDTWTGDIIYGGGPSHIAYYGVYELNRPGIKVGYGPHDFFDGLQVFDTQIEDTLEDHFAPLLGTRGRVRRT